MKVLTKKKIESILNTYNTATILLSDKYPIIIIDDIEYIEKKTIYSSTNLTPFDITNIENKVSRLRHCLYNQTINIKYIMKDKRKYKLYSLKDIKKLELYKVAIE